MFIQRVNSLHIGSCHFSKHYIALTAAMAIALASWQSHAAVSDFETEEHKAMGGLQLINASTAYDLGYTGAGVTLGIFDTAVNAAHLDLSGKTTVFPGIQADGTTAYWPQDSEDWDRQAHGTHVSAIAAGNKNGTLMHGVAFDSSIAAQQALPFFGDMLNASDEFFQVDNLRVINNSWTYGGWYKVEDYDKYGYAAKDESTLPVADAVDSMRTGLKTENVALAKLISWSQTEKGKNGVVVFAAGNQGRPDPVLPALTPYYYGNALNNWINVVSADNRYTHLVESASEGTKVVIESGGMPSTTNMAGVTKLYTVMAPGNWINSADAANPNGLRIMGGTSMAAPHVSGAVAVVAQAFPWMTGKQLADTILSTANSNIELPKVLVTFNMGESPPHLDFYVTDPSVLEEDGTLSRDNMVKYVTEAHNKMSGEFGGQRLGFVIDHYVEDGKPDGKSLFVHKVAPEDIYGQGFLDLGKAVGGIARLDVNRMTKDSIVKVDGVDYAMETFNVTPTALGTDFDFTFDFTNDIDERLWDDTWHHKEMQYGDGTATKYNADALALKNKHAGIIKQGRGLLTLFGKNTYQGPTVVKEGYLSISKRPDGTGGELTSSNVVVHKNAWLMGDGNIHQKVVNNGVLLPGNLSQTGGDALYIHEYVQTPDGAMLLVLAADGSHNQLKVDTATVKGTLGIGLSHEFYTNDFSKGADVKDLIVQATNENESVVQTMSVSEAQSTGLDIQFSSVELVNVNQSKTLTVTPEAVRDSEGNITRFTISIDRAEDAYSKFAVNGAQKQTADAIMKAASDDNGSNTALKSWIGTLDFSSEDTVRRTLKETTPVSYAQVLSASLDARRSLAAMTRASIHPAAEGSNVWAVPLGGRMHRDGTSVNVEVRSTLYGALFGGTWAAAPEWSVGLQGAVYERKDDAVGGTFDFESTGLELGLHAAWNSDAIPGLYATGFASVGWADAQNYRMTALEGPMQTDWTEFGTTLSALAGWRMQSTYGQFGPFIGLEYNTVHQSDVTEDPTKGGALVIDGQTVDDFSSLVGVDYMHAFASDNLNLRISAQAAWRHGFSDTTIESKSTFAGNRSVAIIGIAEREGRDSAMLGASFAMENKDGLSLSVSVSAEANAHSNLLFGAVQIQKRF